jgi:hypothetical protein
MTDMSQVGTPSTAGQKRKRFDGVDVASEEEHGEEQGRSRHVPKRACNECRQQKVCAYEELAADARHHVLMWSPAAM